MVGTLLIYCFSAVEKGINLEGKTLFIIQTEYNLWFPVAQHDSTLPVSFVYTFCYNMLSVDTFFSVCTSTTHIDHITI